MKRLPRLLELNALGITIIYLITALLWILLSDQLLIWVTDDPLLISRYQTFKGIFYVLLTALLLYILINKGNLKTISQKKRTDTALYAAGMATWSVDLKTKDILRSEFHYKIFGLKKNPTKWTIDDFYDSIHPEDRQRVRDVLEKTIQQDLSSYQVKFRIYTADGDLKWMQSRGNLVYDKHNELVQLAGVVADITEQKKLEEDYQREKELFESIFEQIPVMINMYDPGINEFRVNNAFEKYLGWSNEEVQEIDLMKACFPDPEIRATAVKSMTEADGRWQELEVINKAGEKRIQSWSNISLLDDTTIGIGLDITDLKASQAEVKESRELFKKTFESLNESVIILDPETRAITNCNKTTCELFGYSEDELIGSTTGMLHIDEAHFKEFAKIGAEDLEQKGLFQTEFKMKRKDGTEFYSDHTVTLVKNTEGEVEKVVSVIRDITERKKHEKKLQNLTERYRKAEEIAAFGHWWRDIKNDQAIFSQGYYDIVGMKPNQRDSKFETSLNLIHPDDRNEYREAFESALESGTLNVRYRIIKPDTGEIGYFQELAQTEYDKEGNPVSISGTIQDMTEREEFQIKLKHRNDFIETTLENLPIGVAVNLMDSGEATLMNSKFSEIYGWPKEVITNVESFFKNVYPDENYRRKIVEMTTADIASENIDRMQWNGIRITTQSGEERIINAKNIPVYDQNLMISTVVDVTAQAEAEKRLADSEYNYRLLFQKSPQPMWIYDPETLRIIEVNNAAIQHYGYSRKEFAEMSLLDIRPEEDHEQLKKEISEGKRENLTEAKEWRHIIKSGEIIYVRITGSSINYFGNKYRLILVSDITEQKKAEERVLASLVEGENKERARIARELHDGLGQYLAAANMNLDAIQSDIKKLSERRQQQFEKGLNLLKHAVTETAQISRNLLPRMVDDYGLALAIEALVDNYSSNTETEIKYFQNIKGLELPREVEFNLYRIAQEGISNAVKYSQASQINVQLIKDELDLILTIDDNGKGFDTTRKDFT
ncbi:MAG TPA: PAS domain S-box protein, partial [Gracilimonas sp.]|uniref:PAS domain-containing sensor histidine kinase n=1 Tax=Gracilimonas sp. TaxID=1974203 RepID=UPI002D85AAC6|nr:PAS domain S-box protein [Gracilimonas sp.]